MPLRFLEQQAIIESSLTDGVLQFQAIGPPERHKLARLNATKGFQENETSLAHGSIGPISATQAHWRC